MSTALRTEASTWEIKVMRGNKVAMAGFMLHIISGMLSVFIGFWAGAQSAVYLSFPLLGTGAVWGLIYFHQRQRALSEEEEETIKALTEKTSSSRMFEDEIDESFSARNRLAQMEKWFLPSAVLAIALAMLGASVLRFTDALVLPAEVVTGRAAPSAVFFAAIAFVLFILGRYAGGLAAASRWKLMDGGAAFSIFCSILSMAVFAGLILAHLELEGVERFFSFLVPVATIVISVELAANFIMHLYRPRGPSAEYYPPYSSRMLSVLARPSGAMKTVAEVLDYQFGFQVSDTWFYRLIERVIAPIILFQVIAFYALTCVLVVQPDEQAVIERFGVPGEEIAGPGLHFKLPWPVERAYKVPARRVHAISLGAEEEEMLEDVLLWTDHHHNGHGEDNFIVGSRALDEDELEDLVAVSLLNTHVTVKYRVEDILTFLYSKEDPAAVLERISSRELSRFLVSADIFEIMGPGRMEASERLMESIKAVAGEAGLGIEIIYAGFENVHPPAEVAGSFQEAMGALEQKHAEILEAEAYRNKLLPLAAYHGRVLETEAKAYKVRRGEIASARVDRFRNQAEAERAAPGIFRARKLMGMMEESLSGARKYLVPSKTGALEVTVIDLTEPVRPELLDIDLTGTGGGR